LTPLAFRRDSEPELWGRGISYDLALAGDALEKLCGGLDAIGAFAAFEGKVADDLVAAAGRRHREFRRGEAHFLSDLELVLRHGRAPVEWLVDASSIAQAFEAGAEKCLANAAGVERLRALREEAANSRMIRQQIFECKFCVRQKNARLAQVTALTA
jgi:hypothetical protein